MRRVPGDAGQWDASRRRTSAPRTVRVFLLFATAAVGTFAMVGRAVSWLGGPVWLSVAFFAVGILLAAYYLVRLLVRKPAGGRRWPSKR